MSTQNTSYEKSRSTANKAAAKGGSQGNMKKTEDAESQTKTQVSANTSAANASRPPVANATLHTFLDSLETALGTKNPELIGRLKEQSDRALVKASLFKMEARDSWNAVTARLDGAIAKLASMRRDASKETADILDDVADRCHKLAIKLKAAESTPPESHQNQQSASKAHDQQVSSSH